MSNKPLYAGKCFGLPVEQVKDYDELSPEQLNQVYRHFGQDKKVNRRFVYAVKKNGDLVTMRERLRSEWGD